MRKGILDLHSYITDLKASKLVGLSYCIRPLLDSSVLGLLVEVIRKDKRKRYTLVEIEEILNLLTTNGIADRIWEQKDKFAALTADMWIDAVRKINEVKHIHDAESVP